VPLGIDVLKAAVLRLTPVDVIAVVVPVYVNFVKLCAALFGAAGLENSPTSHVVTVAANVL
jgi:hypothetical protein